MVDTPPPSPWLACSPIARWLPDSVLATATSLLTVGGVALFAAGLGGEGAIALSLLVGSSELGSRGCWPHEVLLVFCGWGAFLLRVGWCVFVLVLDTFDVKIAALVQLCIPLFLEYPERICGGLNIASWWLQVIEQGRVVVVGLLGHLLSGFLFQGVPLLFEFILDLLHRVQRFRYGSDLVFIGASIWHTVAQGPYTAGDHLLDPRRHQDLIFVKVTHCGRHAKAKLKGGACPVLLHGVNRVGKLEPALVPVDQAWAHFLIWIVRIIKLLAAKLEATQWAHCLIEGIGLLFVLGTSLLLQAADLVIVKGDNSLVLQVQVLIWLQTAEGLWLWWLRGWGRCLFLENGLCICFLLRFLRLLTYGKLSLLLCLGRLCWCCGPSWLGGLRWLRWCHLLLLCAEVRCLVGDLDGGDLVGETQLVHLHDVGALLLYCGLAWILIWIRWLLITSYVALLLKSETQFNVWVGELGMIINLIRSKWYDCWCERVRQR